MVHISASVELWTVIVCRFEDQCTGPPTHIMNPDCDIDLNNSSKTLDEHGLDIDASCGSQWTLVKGTILKGSTRNLTNPYL